MKIRTLYIGFVEHKYEPITKPVSASTSARKAGELMEQWLKDYDPTSLDYVIGGVGIVSGSDYIDLGEENE